MKSAMATTGFIACVVVTVMVIALVWGISAVISLLPINCC